MKPKKCFPSVLTGVLLLAAWASSQAIADSVPFAPGNGVRSYTPDLPREVVWQQDPNLEGFVLSSEDIPGQISSEVADDFVLAEAATVRSVTWWGGFFNGPPHVDLAGFHLRWFREGDCAPAEMIREELILGDAEETQIPGSSIYSYRADVSPLELEPGVRYWLVIQARNWFFPPQWGRVAALVTAECPGQFRCAEFGYPDWTTASELIGQPYDAAFALSTDSEAEACCTFEGYCMMLPPTDCNGTPQGPGSVCFPTPCVRGACCFGQECYVFDQDYCERYDGNFIGEGTDCSPNPCIPSPVMDTSWGRLKTLYR